MSTRIPVALNWLINKRARLDGKIQEARKAIETAHRLAKELPKLRADLEAIDRTMQLHEVRVEPENIRPVSPPAKQRIPLPHGELTRALLSFLRDNRGSSLSTDELTYLLIQRFTQLQPRSQDELNHLRTSVRYRLKAMAAEKVILRLPSVPGSGCVGEWAILAI